MVLGAVEEVAEGEVGVVPADRLLRGDAKVGIATEGTHVHRLDLPVGLHAAGGRDEGAKYRALFTSCAKGRGLSC